MRIFLTPIFVLLLFLYGSLFSVVVMASEKVVVSPPPNWVSILDLKNYSVLIGAKALEHVELTKTSDDENLQFNLELQQPLEPNNRGVSILNIVGIAISLMSIVLMFLSLNYRLVADKEYSAKGKYFPISPQKFIILSVLTIGLYPFFWSLKFWKWAVENRGLKLWPYWRSFFPLLWIYAKIGLINLETKNKNFRFS